MKHWCTATTSARGGDAARAGGCYTRKPAPGLRSLHPHLNLLNGEKIKHLSVTVDLMSPDLKIWSILHIITDYYHYLSVLCPICPHGLFRSNAVVMIWILSNTTQYCQLLPLKTPGVGGSPPRIFFKFFYYELLRITTKYYHYYHYGHYFPGQLLRITT